jgi:hypothetical protein
MSYAQKVDLCVLNPGGIFFDRDIPQSEVITGRDGSDGRRVLGHEPGTWHWSERVEE